MRRIAVSVLFLGLAAGASAQERVVVRPPALTDLPEPLRPWAAWVLRPDAARVCPLPDGAAEETPDSEASAAAGLRRCAWPSRLVLDVGEKEGKFQQSWKVYLESLVPLPG